MFDSDFNEYTNVDVSDVVLADNNSFNLMTAIIL